MTPFAVIPSTTEEITRCTTEAAKGANKAPINSLSGFLISCFTVLVTLSINIRERSRDFMILIISFKSSFEMNKTNPFFARTALFPTVFSFKSNYLPKFICFFLPKLPKQEPKICQIISF